MRELKEFLLRNMYRHYRVVRMGDKAGRILRDLFESYVGEPRPAAARTTRSSSSGTASTAWSATTSPGMTDRFAVDEHQKLFDPTVRV